jgi:phage terminase large subunit-like protein
VQQQRPSRAKDNAILITKQASGSAKIDLLMAAFNAIALMAANMGSTQRVLFLRNWSGNDPLAVAPV